MMSLRLPPVSEQASGVPPAGDYVMLGAGFFAPPKRPHVRATDRRPRPVDQLGLLQLRQQELVQPLPNTRLLPLPQPTPAGDPRTTTHLLRQVLPRNPRPEHEQDPGQHFPVVDPLAPRKAVPPRHLRDQRLDQLPQLVRHQRPRHPRLSLPVEVDAARFAAEQQVPAF